MQTRAPGFLRELYAGIQASELRASLLVLTLVGLVLAAVAARNPGRSGWAYAMLVFGAVIGVNALAHVGFAIAFRSYMPGLVTAVLVTLPISAVVLIRGRREAWVPRTAYWTIAPAAIIVHGPLLAGFVRATIGVVRAIGRGAA